MSGQLIERAGTAGRVSLVSPRLEALGVPHGFTTRAGGLDVATAADLAGPLADAGLRGGPAFIGVQVHGRRISTPADRGQPADGHFAPPGGGVVAVRTADCLGVLLAGPAGVVAAHAGWRGVLGGVLGAAVDALGGGQRVEAVAMGPCIGADAFEVGPEVASAFASAGLGGLVLPAAGDRSRVDLSGAALARLESCGVTPRRIDRSGRCTLQEAEHFYSFRRDGPGRGHQAAWIGQSRADGGAAWPVP